MTLRLFSGGVISFLAACASLPESPPSAPGPSVATGSMPLPQAAPSPPVVPAAAIVAPRAARVELSGILFEGVSFDARSHRLRVVEQAGEPGSRYADASAAARESGGLAAVNGGFFTPEGAPLGLVIAGGKRHGAWNGASSLGSGVWHADQSGHAAISRREALGKARANTMQELLQAGPMLVERGRAVGGLDASKTSARTVILWDGAHRWWIGRSAPCTLARCAAVLAQASPAGWPVHHALNLDGGRSSELWVSATIAGGPIASRTPWNRPVRNFLVLVPR